MKNTQCAFIVALALICRTAIPAASPDVNSAFSAEAARHSLLGNAVDNIAPNENGYQQYFENGAIFYLDSAFEVHGLILGKYRQLEGPWGYLGFPLSDELTCSDGDGRYSDFQYGSVYYHPTHGTHQVTGSMLSKWRSQGAESGALGYPVDDPVVTDTGMIQRFQRGFLSVNCRAVDMREHMYALGMRIRNQSWRGTCSVFAMTCLLEYDYAQLLGGDYADLSEEYMNHVANLASGETDDGSCFAPVASGYAAYGVVPESDLPYDLSKTYDFASFILPAAIVSKGRSLLATPFKLKEIVIKPGCPSPSSMGMSTGQLDTVFAELNKGYPVAVGRGHSLVIVGYVLDSAMPGGGFFIIRNSYGPDANDHGFRYETINHCKTTVYDTYVYEMPAGVAFGKVLRGRVVDNSGTGVANARVEISGATALYGTFTRYDSTDGSGYYCIQKIISLASTVSVQSSGSLGTINAKTALSADTTVFDFPPKTTDAGTHQAAVDRFSANITARSGRNGTIEVSVPISLESMRTVSVYGLDGRRLVTKGIPRGADRIIIPYNGNRQAVLLYSLAIGQPAITKNGVVGLHW